MHKLESFLDNETYKVLRDFEIQTNYLISARRPDIVKVRTKVNITCRKVDFPVSAEHRGKIKESQKRDKYQDLARGLRKLWNMKMTVIRIVFHAPGTIPKLLINGLGDLEIIGQVEHTPTLALVRSGRILRRVLEAWGGLKTLAITQTSERIYQVTLVGKTLSAVNKLEEEWTSSKLQHYWERLEYWQQSWTLEETCWLSKFSEIPSATTGVKNSQWVNNNNNKAPNRKYTLNYSKRH